LNSDVSRATLVMLSGAEASGRGKSTAVHAPTRFFGAASEWQKIGNFVTRANLAMLSEVEASGRCNLTPVL
jgi:transcription termination factor Rho